MHARRRHSRSRALGVLTASVVAVVLTSCDALEGIEACAITAVEASPAAGNVLEATVHSGGLPLRGRPVTFEVFAGERIVAAGEVTADRRGVARFDIEAHVDTDELLHADEFTATHAGTRTWCESHDTAPVRPTSG